MRFNPPSSGLASSVLFFSAAVWGLYWLPLRHLEAVGIEGVWAVAALNLPAGLLFAAVAVGQARAHRGWLGRVLAVGALTGIGLALYACGLIYSSVIRATLLFYLTPVWATLIGIFWLGEQAGWKRWGAIAIGLAGLGLLVSGGGATPLGLGDLFALSSGVFWAAGAAVIKRHPGAPLAGMTGAQFLFTALGALALGGLAGLADAPPLERFAAGAPLALVVSIGVLAPTIWLIFWAQKHVFPGRAGLLMMSEVMAAAASASLLLPEERMSTLEWAGAALIVGACVLELGPARGRRLKASRRAPARRRRRPPATGA